MDNIILYSICGIFLLSNVYPAVGIRNTVGHVPKVRRKEVHDVISGHSKKKATVNKELTATVSRTTVSDVELTNSIGNILTDEELEAIMPYLAKSTWFPINSDKEFHQKNEHRDTAEQLQVLKKSSEKGWQSLTAHERRKHFRVKGLGKTFKGLNGHKAPNKKHNLHARKEKKSHLSVEKKNVIGSRYDTGLMQQTPPVEDASSVFHRAHSRHNNHLSLLPSDLVTVQPPTNRRHHRVHLSNSVTLSNRNHDNSVHRSTNLAGSRTDADMRMLKLTGGTAKPHESVSVGDDHKSSKQRNNTKLYEEAVENWRRKATKRMLKGDFCDCVNGGSCIMKVVCVCPPEYYGIRCQHKLHHHSCGDIRHGAWIRNGCNLCRCQDGNMLCITSDLEGCAEEFDEREEILEPETVDTEFDSYIDSSVTNIEDQDDNQDYLGSDLSDILTVEYQIIPLPSSAHSIAVLMQPLSLTVAITSISALLRV